MSYKSFVEKTGGFLVVIRYLLSAISVAFPFIAIGCPWWLMVLVMIIEGIVPLPMVTGWVNIGLWIWGLVATIGGKQDSFAYAYYILFAIYAIYFLWILILSVSDIVSEKAK